MECTLFLKSLSLANTNKLVGLPTREYATYNCPCEKHIFPKSKVHRDVVWPRDISNGSANAHLVGNCTHFNSNVKFLVIIHILLGTFHSKWRISSILKWLIACHCTAVVGSKYEAKLEIQPSVVNGAMACLANPMSSKTRLDNLHHPWYRKLYR